MKIWREDDVIWEYSRVLEGTIFKFTWSLLVFIRKIVSHVRESSSQSLPQLVLTSGGQQKDRMPLSYQLSYTLHLAFSFVTYGQKESKTYDSRIR
jgi:hypothetical protein